jgi:hypothetical protein
MGIRLSSRGSQIRRNDTLLNACIYKYNFLSSTSLPQPLSMYDKYSFSHRLTSLHWSIYISIMTISLIAAVIAATLSLHAKGAALPEKPQHEPLKPPASSIAPGILAATDIPKPHFGKIELLSASSGVPAMHAAAMLDGKIVFLDKIENYTQLRLPNGQLAYSSIYDPELQTTPKPLAYKTNAFCCGGSFLTDGRLVTVGGNG